MPPKKRQKKVEAYVQTISEALMRISDNDDSLTMLRIDLADIDLRDNAIFWKMAEKDKIIRIKELAKALKDHPRVPANLLEVRLRHGFMGEQGVIAFSESIGLCTLLKSLVLNNMDISDHGHMALCKPLARCTALRNLNLSRCDSCCQDRDWSCVTIGDEGTVAFSKQVLSVCTDIVTLDLCKQKIGDKGLIALADSLRTCTHLNDLRQDYY